MGRSGPLAARWSVGRVGRSLRFLFELELVVLSQDVLMRRTMVRHVWMVMPAQDIWRPIQGMVADTPAALCVTVHLAHAGVNTEGDGADQRGLTNVGAETGPEVVIEIWSAMERPRVEREPMTEGAEEADQKRDSKDQEDDADHPDEFVSSTLRGNSGVGTVELPGGGRAYCCRRSP